MVVENPRRPGWHQPMRSESSVAAKTVGVDGIGVDTLRHSAAVAWLEAGTHIGQVADLLGHSSIAVTGDTYGHGSDDGARRAVHTLGGRLGL